MTASSRLVEVDMAKVEPRIVAYEMRFSVGTRLMSRLEGRDVLVPIPVERWSTTLWECRFVKRRCGIAQTKPTGEWEDARKKEALKEVREEKTKAVFFAFEDGKISISQFEAQMKDLGYDDVTIDLYLGGED